MRGRSSSAKSRLRSAGYKCNLCGRRVVDAATLENHLKNIHNISTRSNKSNSVFKAKITTPRNKLSSKDKDKIFDALRDDIQPQSKATPRHSKIECLRSATSKVSTKPKEVLSKTGNLTRNGKTVNVDKNSKQLKNEKDSTKKVDYECPVCNMTFNAYLTAHRHIQKFHPVDADGKKVPLNSSEMVKAIRVEQCLRCSSKMRSNEHHICSKINEEGDNGTSDYVCSGCNQTFVSLKMFDVHVAGLHSEGVDSMFFPTKIEYTNWRLEMEWQTNAKFSVFGEYDSKRVYRCKYAHENLLKAKSLNYICPSSLVVQDFSKGIQVHFYNKHYGHPATDYILSSKYNKYSIKSFLKNPTEGDSTRKPGLSKKFDDEDLFSQFKKLMDGIVLIATDVDNTTLTKLIERALDMSTLITDSDIATDTFTKTKPAKNMTDKEITEELQFKNSLNKRRRSVDTYDTPPPNPAKRARNKSLYVQTNDSSSPKIINTFSLATTSNSEFSASVSDANETEIHTSISERIKMFKRQTGSNELPSFNDSYKDFIDKNFIGKADRIKNLRSFSSSVKTKLGELKPTSPITFDTNDVFNDTAVDNIGDMASITAGNSTFEFEDTNLTSNTKNSNVKILSVENPNVTITKMKTVNPPTRKVTTQVSTPKADKRKVSHKPAFSHLVDPLQVQITKVTKSATSPTIELGKGNISKINTRSVASVPVDPLELNFEKVSTKSTPNILKTYKGTPKVNRPQIETTKLDMTTADTSKVYLGKATSGEISPVAIRGTPKVTTKVSEDVARTGTSYTGIIKPKRIKEFKYEVREQENDCNILVLKL